MDKNKVREYILEFYQYPLYMKERTISKYNSDIGLFSVGLLIIGLLMADSAVSRGNTDAHIFTRNLIFLLSVISSITTVITKRCQIIYSGTPKKKYVDYFTKVITIIAVVIFIPFYIITGGGSGYGLHLRVQAAQLSIETEMFLLLGGAAFLIFLFSWFVASFLYIHYLIMRYCPDIKDFTVEDAIEEARKMEIAAKEEKRKMRKTNKKK